MSYTGIPGLSKGKAPRELKEEDLLNDIEASTKRLYQQVCASKSPYSLLVAGWIYLVFNDLSFSIVDPVTASQRRIEDAHPLAR